MGLPAAHSFEPSARVCVYVVLRSTLERSRCVTRAPFYLGAALLSTPAYAMALFFFFLGRDVIKRDISPRHFRLRFDLKLPAI